MKANIFVATLLLFILGCTVQQSDQLTQQEKEIVAAVAALLSLGAIVGVNLVLQRIGFKRDGITTAVLFVVPLCIYMLVSGRLTELSAPGGWQLKFKKVISEGVEPAQLVPVVPIAVLKVYKLPQYEELIHSPNCLKITLEDSSNSLPVCEYLHFVNHSLAAGQVKYVVLVKGTNQFHSMIPFKSIATNSELTTPQGECRAYELIDWIRENNLEKLSGLNGYVGVEKAASTGWTKQRCLREMYEMGLETLPVVKRREIIGFLERTQLVAEILVDVTGRLGE